MCDFVQILMFDCASVYMCTHAGKCVNVDVRGCVRTSARVRAVVCARVSKYVAACGHPGHTRADARGYGCVCCTQFHTLLHTILTNSLTHTQPKNLLLYVKFILTFSLVYFIPSYILFQVIFRYFFRISFLLFLIWVNSMVNFLIIYDRYA